MDNTQGNPMKKIFLVEYYNGETYVKQYFTDVVRAAHNLEYWQSLERDATIETIHVETATWKEINS
jgi:hypothetical protein